MLQFVRQRRGLAVGLIASLMISLASLQAKAQFAMPEDGFSGFVSFLPSYVSVESQFQTDDDNRVTSDLANPGKPNDGLAPVLTGEIRYTVSDWNAQVYFGLPSETIREGTVLQAELGGRYWLDNGTRLSASFLPPPFALDDTWADPFVVNQAREKTDFDVWGVRLRADRIAGSQFGLRYEYGDLEIDNETSGTFLAAQPGSTLTQRDLDLLRRDASFHRLTATYAYQLSEEFWLRPALRYIRRDAEGEANSFDAIRPELGLAYIAGRVDTSVNLIYVHEMYDEENPVFGRKQDTSGYRGVFSFGYRQPFDLDNVRWEVFATYSRDNSDIEFYDSKTFLVGTGFSYSF